MKRKISISTLLFTLFLSSNLFGQINPLGKDNSFLALDRHAGFAFMTGAGIGSILLSKFATKDTPMDFYQAHVGYFGGNDYSVFMQNFGVERAFSSWFALRLEANVQEFSKPDYSSAGIGLKFYCRWTALGKKKLSPFFEYGAGIFNAFTAFPEGGSNFTFNLSYAIGFEYQLENQNKIRLDVDFLHHSNSGLFDTNPGFDGNGLSLSYSWFWK